jgi:hypothetical protein
MKKRALMSLVVLVLIGTRAVFAQQSTLDKLKFTILGASSGADHSNSEFKKYDINKGWRGE